MTEQNSKLTLDFTELLAQKAATYHEQVVQAVASGFIKTAGLILEKGKDNADPSPYALLALEETACAIEEILTNLILDQVGRLEEENAELRKTVETHANSVEDNSEGSSKGRTADFDSVNAGSTPAPSAI